MLPELHQCSDFIFFINSLFADVLVSGSTNSKNEEQYQSHDHRRRQQIASFARVVRFINKVYQQPSMNVGFPTPACSVWDISDVRPFILFLFLPAVLSDCLSDQIYDF